jgi:hypothetical protein
MTGKQLASWTWQGGGAVQKIVWSKLQAFTWFQVPCSKMFQVPRNMGKSSKYTHDDLGLLD